MYLQASAAKVLVDRGDLAEASGSLDDLTEIAQQAQADVREYLMGAKAVMAARGEFFPALREYLVRFSRQYNLPVQLSAPAEVEQYGLAPETEVQLLRIIQEALSNVRKHAGPANVQVVFSREDAGLQVAVIDDGCGFDPTSMRVPDGFGLHSMRQRAEAIGGVLTVTSAPGEGAQVTVVLGNQPKPLPACLPCPTEPRGQ